MQFVVELGKYFVLYSFGVGALFGLYCAFVYGRPKYRMWKTTRQFRKSIEKYEKSNRNEFQVTS